MRPVQQYQTVHGFYLSCRKISATADEASKAGSGGGGGGGGKIGGGPGKAAMPGPSNLAAFRATLWTHLDQVSRTLPIWEHREEKFVNVVYRALGKRPIRKSIGFSLYAESSGTCRTVLICDKICITKLITWL